MMARQRWRGRRGRGGARPSVRKDSPVVNARGTCAPESTPAAYKSEGRGKRRFLP
jgi:hypothetical protein